MKKVFRIVRKALAGALIAAAALFGIDIGARQASQKSVPLPKEYVDAVKPIFGKSVDYSQVRITFGKVSVFQKSSTIMTFGNTIYYPAPLAPKPDNLFAHEMTHIWQHQNHIPKTGLLAVAGLRLAYNNYADAYAYVPDSTKKLTDYNLEQQAEIVSDYFTNKALMPMYSTRHLHDIVDPLAKIIGTCVPLDPDAPLPDPQATAKTPALRP